MNPVISVFLPQEAHFSEKKISNQFWFLSDFKTQKLTSQNFLIVQLKYPSMLLLYNSHGTFKRKSTNFFFKRYFFRIAFYWKTDRFFSLKC